MILCYHKVHPVAKTIWWLTVDTFYRQMAALRSRKVVHLDDYDSANSDHVVITFDGVYDNVLEFAVPVLEHFGYPFELFVIGDYVGRENTFDQAVEPPCRFANLPALEEMSRRGGRVQWHTRAHGRFSELNAAGQERELSIPDDLARSFATPHLRWFAYPHGAVGDDSRALVRERFVGGLACDGGNPMDRYYLPRQLVFEQHGFFKGRVSAIVANYNYGRFLADAVESLERQSVAPDEILVIDDASTDESPEVLDQLEARGYRVERNPKNLGIVENFRKAVSLTRGDYVFFLGADNRLRRDFVLECRIALDSDARAAVAYTDMLLWGTRAGQLARSVGAVKIGRSQVENWDVYHWSVPDPTPEALGRFATHNFVHGSSMYRRSVYDAVGGYRSSAGPEDHHLFYRMWREGGGGLIHVPQPLLEYRQHSTAQANTALGLQMENRSLRERVLALGREGEAVRVEGLRVLDAERSLTHSLTGTTHQLVSRLTELEEAFKHELGVHLAALDAERAARAEEHEAYTRERATLHAEKTSMDQELGQLQSSLGALAAEKGAREEDVRRLEQRIAMAERDSRPVELIAPIARHLLKVLGRHWEKIARWGWPQVFGQREIAATRTIFDADWYARNSGGQESRKGAWRRFTRQGLAAGRDPSPLFDGRWYLDKYADVAASGMPAFTHYMAYGWREGRQPHPLFDGQWYLTRYPDVAASGMNPLAHFVGFGASEGRDPHPLFDSRWYRETYAEVAGAAANPLREYLTAGSGEGRNPNPLFDSAWYLRTYLEVARSRRNPLVDYVVEGAKAGRDPNAIFKTSWYVARHPSVTDIDMNPLGHALRWAPEDIAPGFDASFYGVQAGLKGRNSADCLAHYLQAKSDRYYRSIADINQGRLDQAMGTGLVLARQAVAVGMVLYNEDEAELIASLASIRAALRHCGSEVSGQIYLLDNSDEPSAFVQADDLTYVRSGDNIGFGGGHNALCRMAFDEGGADAYVGINPDGFLHRDALAALLRMHAAQSGQALIEAQQFPEEHPKIYDPESLETPWISCSCYLIPKAIHEAVGGFDPNIFLYCEDVDLSWSARRAGYRTMMCPAALFFHDVSDRGDEPWRFREMLVSGRYLGHKWGNERFRAWTEDLLVERGFARYRHELPPLDDLEPLPDRTSAADFEHGFSFAPVRW